MNLKKNIRSPNGPEYHHKSCNNFLYFFSHRFDFEVLIRTKLSNIYCDMFYMFVMHSLCYSCHWTYKSIFQSLFTCTYFCPPMDSFVGETGCKKESLVEDLLGASIFSVLKLIKIVILWIYFTVPFGFS